MLPDGQRPLGTKWVFKKRLKQDNSIRCTRSFSPVAMETTVRVMITVQLYYSERKGWNCEVIDIEAAFLNAGGHDLENGPELFIEWPHGLYKLGQCMELSLQASREWFLTLI
eukprot:scaffold97848_cov69-Attheya_sp.AAC.1